MRSTITADIMAVIEKIGLDPS